MLKRILLLTGVVLPPIVIALAAIILVDEYDSATVSGHTRNENLETIKPGWPGTPIDQQGRFVNTEFPFLPKLSGLLRWQLGSRPRASEKKSDTARLEVADPTEFLESNQDGMIWLGHAAIYIRLNGKAILIDPTFGKPPFIRELVELPSPLDKIRKLDYVLVSHDHRDHCDETSLKNIAEKFPNATFLGGLRMDELYRDWVQPTNEVQGAGWYQKFKLKDDDVEIFFVPVRHWSRRGLADTNYRLWGGYVIRSGDISIYHSGDTGYGSHFRETGELFPGIDYFAAAIGAYEPRWFMEPNHMMPDEAVKAFQDAGAINLVPMHYGTFDMADEPPGEPLRLLSAEAEKQGIKDKLRPLLLNGSIYFDK